MCSVHGHPAWRTSRGARRDAGGSRDSHWVNGTSAEREGRVRITLVPAAPPVKRLVFHHTRNTAATDLRAGGMDEADAMKIKKVVPLRGNEDASAEQGVAG